MLNRHRHYFCDNKTKNIFDEINTLYLDFSTYGDAKS